MKKTCFSLLMILLSFCGYPQNWHPAGDKIKTQWAEKVDPANPLPEYPRPALIRDQWLNLNGLWDYAILPEGSALPAAYDGKILVPFAVESSLSGVQKPVGIQNELWYHREFTVPVSWKNKKVILNFGAVDWKADIWINDLQVGSHKGGYTPFSIDISPFLLANKVQKLTVRVWDPADQGFQPRGKQVSRPSGIWYTSVTGIWQTVWLEPVEDNYITRLKTVTNIDRNTVTVTAFTEENLPADITEVKILESGKIVARGKGIAGREVLLSLPEAKLWSPESPFLYDIEVVLLRKEKAIDQVKSYLGMRKISTKKDPSGVVRLQLNNKDYFQFGPLDQGWWPDGRYTDPTDEALKFDIVKTKELGFNLIRKHVKVEPARWYYHCDHEGILVWQDMPSGDDGPEWQTKTYDPTRLVDPASGGNFTRLATCWIFTITLIRRCPCMMAAGFAFLANMGALDLSLKIMCG